MHQLSGLDASFLYLETADMPMHVGALNVMVLPAGYRGRILKVLRRLVKARLPLLPALRRRLWWMPLNIANPAWVDAEPDLAEHIVAHRLPPTARQGDGMAALQAQVAKLHSQLLDRSRPLWKFHVLVGLAPAPDGCKRIAVYSQLHHAAVDGQAAVALANVLFDLTPTPRRIELHPSKRTKHFQLDMVEMLRGALGREALQVGQILRDLPQTLGRVGRAAGRVIAHTDWLNKDAATGRVSNLALAPRTALNVSVGPRRSFATQSVPLDGLLAAAHAQGGTLNDGLLMLCAGGLRHHWQTHRKALPRKAMVAAVPISLRAAGDLHADNQASMGFISLGTQIADPRRRFRHILAATAAMKDTMGSLKQVLPTDYPSLGAPWLLQAATALYGRAKVADRLPPLANLVVSNVPGPRVPLYFAGGRIVGNYPTSIVVHGVALNITAQSMGERLDIGLMADAQAMPDVDLLAQGMALAWQELQQLSPRAAPPAGARSAG